MKLYEKEQKLTKSIKGNGKVAVAFSGGVDSTLLLKECVDTLGCENVVAITACSLAFPEREKSEAQELCNQLGVKQIMFDINQLDIPGFAQNLPNRCYLCKKALFKGICYIAKSNGCRWIAEGSNLDDLDDYRPGMQAIKELGVSSPLQEAGLTKAEIRELSARHSLPTYSKQSFACLATRLEYGDTITDEKLEKIGNAEQFLLDMGFEQVRVRLHSNSADIEVAPHQRQMLLDNADKITNALLGYGFSFVTMSLSGYRQGSMNKTI